MQIYTRFHIAICRSNCFPKPVDKRRFPSPKKTIFDVFGPW